MGAFTLKPKFDPTSAPSWGNVAERVKWNYAFEKYATEWFAKLSSEEIKDIFNVFIQQINNIDVSMKEYSYYPGETKREVKLSLRELCYKVIANQDSAIGSRNLYELFNYKFFTMKKRLAQSEMLDATGYKAWESRVVKALRNPKDTKDNANGQLSTYFVSKQNGNRKSAATEVEAYDYHKDLNEARVPQVMVERFKNLEAKSRKKLGFNLDPKTHHAVTKIFEEYVPAMVESYANAYHSDNAGIISKVDRSVKKQMTILEEFVNSVEVDTLSTAVSKMELQEQFLLEKFQSNSLATN